MKIPTLPKLLLALTALALPMLARAANISLTANDANGTVTSLNGAGKWSNLQAPSPANDYFTSTFFIRTPTDGGSTSYTFAGNSLTLQSPLSGNVRSVIVKSGNNDTFIINNLTNAYGGILENGGSGNVVATFTGNRFTIAGNSAVVGNQGSIIIGYPLVGADGVILTNAGGNAGGITYNNNNSAFTGKFYISTINFGNGGGNTTVILNGANSAPGNPSTFTADQIRLSGGCTLQDSFGLTLNNPNSGITLGGNATISAVNTTVLAEPVTDFTNGVSSVSTLTKAGAGTLTLSAANNNYTGGTIISAGTLQLGVDNAIPGGAIAGDVTVTGTLDMNAHNGVINGMNGAGSVVNSASGTPMLTVGANGDNGTFTGSISGSMGVAKVGAGTQALTGGCSFSGPLLALGGALSVVAANVPGIGSVTISNATLSVDDTGGTGMPVAGLTFLTNAVLNLAYGTVSANPGSPAINVNGGISATATNIQINVSALGLKVGTFTLIKYTGAALANLANFSLAVPPGVNGLLVNNTGNDSIDLQVISTPNQLSWNGVHGANWDLATANWSNLLTGGITVFRQYTNGSVIAGDSVRLDDTLTNDFVNPQPTNILLSAPFYVFPFTVDSTLPYTISGAGGILGSTSLVKTNSGSLTLNVSNAYTGGTFVFGGTLAINNDSALGAASGPLTLDGGALEITGNSTNNVRAVSMPVTSTIGVAAGATARLGGVISGAGTLNKNDNGTLVLAGKETFTGDLFLHNGTTVIDSGGSLTNGSYHDVGQNGTDSATLTLQGTGSLSTTSDFNVGDLDSSAGTLNVSGSATLTVNAFYIGSANAAGSTASGTVNQSGGTITEVSTGTGTFAIGGRTSTSGLGVYNMSGGTLNAGAGIRVGGTGIGTLNQTGGTINATLGVNIARIAGSFGTNNLNGGTLATYNVTSSTSTNAIFNLNGGTLMAAFNPATPWVSALSQANILAGGAIIDSSNFNVTISQPLLAGSANGGLTKKGAGTLTLTGVNTFTGPITNNAGTLFLNSASTYPGAVAVNAGTLQLTTASALPGTTTVGNNATLSIVQLGGATANLGNLVINGAAAAPGGLLGLTPTTANNPAVAMVNCGSLTLNGTNTISLAAVNVGTVALVKYVGAIAGSGNITNLSLPQGASGYISNNAANSTLYAVITSTGPGLVWTGTNNVSPNVWDIGVTTNWLVNATPTSYHQIISPGDAVIFNDVGSGTVILNTNVSPAGVVISNNTKTYTFSGTKSISGATGLLKLGGGAAILNLTNNSYLGNTAISNGTLQVVNNGAGPCLSPSANLVIGPSGTLQLSSLAINGTTTVGEFSGAGQISYTGGVNSILAFGGSAGGVWNGTIRDAGGGGLSLTKAGSGTWVIGGTNYLNNADFFNAVSQNQFNGGTTIITNGGFVGVASTEFWIAQGVGSTSTLVVAGGTLIVSNDWLCVGRGDATANGTLIVNSGTVQKAGNNSLVVGSTGATGTLIVNGGRVLNNSEILLGEGPTSVANLYLNGGLLQATDIRENNNGGLPTVSSVAYFNGGTLQASSNSADFLQVQSEVMSNGVILDDNGYSVSIGSAAFQSGDSFNGGLIKQGSGAVYLDGGNSYTGTTLVTNGLLAGIGSVSGPLVVAPAGNLGAGDASGIGGFTINSDLTLRGNATLRIDKSGGSLAQDQVTVNGNISYGGILTVTNITSDANLLTTSDSFQLFNVTGSHSGNFAGIAGSPGAGLAYSFNPATGVLSVITPTIATNPTNITFRVSGNTLNLSWPGDHKGWILQSQTNSLGQGLSTNWVDVAGSDLVTNTPITINPANPTMFFRLRLP